MPVTVGVFLVMLFLYATRIVRVTDRMRRVVIGATITVRRYWFSSSGEMTRQGRVFWISLPSMGSR